MYKANVSKKLITMILIGTMAMNNSMFQNVTFGASEKSTEAVLTSEKVQNKKETTTEKQKKNKKKSWHGIQVPSDSPDAGSVSFYLYGKDTKKPLANANMTLAKKTDGSWDVIRKAETDQKGNILIKHLKPGTYRFEMIEASKGYDKEKIQLSSKSFEITSKDSEGVLSYGINEKLQYQVSFDLQGHGSRISKEKGVLYGETAQRPKNPKASGYTFDGWYQDVECTDPYSFSKSVTSDVTLYAKWDKEEPKTETATSEKQQETVSKESTETETIIKDDSETKTPDETGSKEKVEQAEYKTEYYLQNIDQSGYTLYETKTKKAAVGETVKAAEKQYNGYVLDAAKTQVQSAGIVSEKETLTLKTYYNVDMDMTSSLMQTSSTVQTTSAAKKQIHRSGTEFATINLDTTRADNKLTDPADFTIGGVDSAKFWVVVNLGTVMGKSFTFTIPKNFTVISAVSGATVSTDVDGNTVYTIVNTSGSGLNATYQIQIQQNPLDLISDVRNGGSGNYEFKTTIGEEAGEGFTLHGFTEAPGYQFNELCNNETWTPYQLAAYNYNATHWSNQADTARYSRMIKYFEVEVDKAGGSLISSDWSVTLPLPVEWQVLTNGAREARFADVYDEANGKWYRIANLDNVFSMVDTKTSTANAGGTKTYTYTGEKEITLKQAAITGYQTDTGFAASPTYAGKSIYEILSMTNKIKFSFASDVKSENAFGLFKNNDTDQDGIVNFTASDPPTLSEDGTVVETGDILKLKLENGSKTTLNVGMAAPEEIQMDTATTQAKGYLAAYKIDTSQNYAIHTNLHLTYEFPYEYSPAGTITLVPNSGIGGGGSGEYNATAYDYVFTITNRNTNDVRVVDKPHVNYASPASYTPDLAEGEWVSKIEVSVPQAWKQGTVNDTSATGSTYSNAVFYTNMQSRSEDAQGNIISNGTYTNIQVTGNTDQAGEFTKSIPVKLIGEEDNIELWSVDNSANKYPVGKYGDTPLKYIELHMKKYSDTVTYHNPYIEVTGDALALLSKITYESTVSTSEKTHLRLVGYRLKNGDWVTVSKTQAAALLDGSYYDLTDIIGNSYLTGVRLAPDELNETTVDDQLEKTYYLYLYDMVEPGHLGYDDTLKKTYTSITDLNSCLSYDIGFHCDYLTEDHTMKTHIPDGKNTPQSKQSATFVYGDLPEKIFNRDNDFDVEAIKLPIGSFVSYTKSELCNVAIDDGPALTASNNYWGQTNGMKMTFGNSSPDEKRTLALTKGITLAGRGWLSPSYVWRATFYGTIRYQTNKSSEWIEREGPFKSNQGSDRYAYYFDLDDDEYLVGLEVLYPDDFLFQSGYSVPGKESDYTDTQIADVGLLAGSYIPSTSPVEGDNHVFHNGEQLDYSAVLSFGDENGQAHELPLLAKTSRLVPLPTMLVDDFKTTVSYDAGGYNQVATGASVDVTATHSYGFTQKTASIDTDKKIRPTIYYEIDKDYTVEDVNALAAGLGTGFHAEFKGNALSNGNGILAISYTKDAQPVARNANFTLQFSLMALPSAKTDTYPPIVNSWMDVTYDKSLDYDVIGYKIAINPESKQLYTDHVPEIQKNKDEDLLTTSVDTEFTVYLQSTEGVWFKGTSDSGGLADTVSNKDKGSENIFGISQTFIAPNSPTTDWVIYASIPTKGQEVPYYDSTTSTNRKADPSEFSLEIINKIEMNVGETVYYYIRGDGDPMIPSMNMLSGGVDPENWKTWEQLSEADKRNVSYVRVEIPSVAGGQYMTTEIPMKLKLTDGKRTVDTLYSYAAGAYNYKKNGEWAFTSSGAGNLETGGKATPKITYILEDTSISGFVWMDLNYDDKYTEGQDRLIDNTEGVTLSVSDDHGNAIYHKDGITPVTVTVNPDGTYKAPVPSVGTYKLTLNTNSDKKLLVQKEVPDGNKNNWSYYTPDTAKTSGNVSVTIPSDGSAVTGILAGIEKWENVVIEKSIEKSTYADMTKSFDFLVNVESKSGGTVTFTGTYDNGEKVTLVEGKDTTISLKNTEKITLFLPVGLNYTVTEKEEPLYTPYITSTKGTSTSAQVQSATVTSKVEEGGNKEAFLNKKNAILVTGIGTGKDSGIYLLLMLSIIVLLFLLQGRTRRKEAMVKVGIHPKIHHYEFSGRASPMPKGKRMRAKPKPWKT